MRTKRFCFLMLATGMLWCFPEKAFASSIGFDGAGLSLAWSLPFVGVLLSIALLPMLMPRQWEHHQGKIMVFWGAATLIPMALIFGGNAAVEIMAHTFLLEYLPFLLLLLALFTTSGSIVLAGNLHASPFVNTLFLAVGAVMASLIGTTGASMILIRPLLRANDNRPHQAHVVIFFIFIVSNVGGLLTPLGDPPLFMGFLKGIDFFWTMQALFAKWLFAVGTLLVVFFCLDAMFFKRDSRVKALRDPTPDSRLRVRGKRNIVLIGVIIAAILMSAWWQPGIEIRILNVSVQVQDIFRNLVFIAVAFVSFWFGNPHYRKANGFSWDPILEVARLFGGIFTAMIPVLAMLSAGSHGAFAPLIAFSSHTDGSPNPAAYFWLTGMLSSFLDNVPTYLVFFELAGGNPDILMTTAGSTLAALSCGAVFMGANSYIGNAPNFMIYAIARSQKIAMPSFFSYMGWSMTILVPVFILVTFIFFL